MKDNEATADHTLESYVGNLNGRGQSLSNEVRSFYEPRFGYDFSNVKVHMGSVAAKSAQSINALAYTSGNNIIFNSGQYSPNTDSGKKLLGHELTHVVQQTEDRSSHCVQRACGIPAIGSMPADCNLVPQTPTGTPFFFKVNCDEFAPGEEARLAAFATTIDPAAGINIRGVASSDGDRPFNEKLSCKRAAAVKNTLTNLAGIPLSRISSIEATGPAGTAGDPNMRSGMISLASITSETVANSPGLRTRTTIGVGEDVNLTHSSGDPSTTWDRTAGQFDSMIGSSIVFTAPDTAQAVTITAGGATIVFTVIAPNDVRLEQIPGTGVKHTRNRADSGIAADVFILPDNVNFNKVIVRELDVVGVATPGAYSCNTFRTGHCPPAGLVPCGDKTLTRIVIAGKGTKTLIGDCAYSGKCRGTPPFASGNITLRIPYEYKVGTGTYRRFATVTQFHALLPGGVVLLTTKAGAFGVTTVSSGTVTIPGCP
jgi:outer membrane protein OmpA-like peptidoglycan-associated protein